MVSQTERDLFAAIRSEDVANLAQDLVRIDSRSFAEHQCADYLADVMRDMGLDVDMMDVRHAFHTDRQSRQPVGRLKGSGGAPSLMFNAHMDTSVVMSGWTVDRLGGEIRDGFLYGSGAFDNKGGIASMVIAAKALIDIAGMPKGDILVTPVAAHKGGGHGVRALIANGVLTDYCINLEHSACGIATACVGHIRGRVKARSGELFFRSGPEERARYWNPIEQLNEICRRMGASLTPMEPDGWLTFERHADMPTMPQIRFDTIHKEHYTRECEMEFQIRTVSGMSAEVARTDFSRLIDRIKKENPNLDVEWSVPADQTLYRDPMWIDKKDPLVLAAIEAHRLAFGEEPYVGADCRLGNVGDANNLQSAGVKCIQYGPGDIRELPEWPAPDERARLSDLHGMAKSVAHTAWRLCYTS